MGVLDTAATAARLLPHNSINLQVSRSMPRVIFSLPDYLNDRVRRVTTSGTISTVAGNGQPGYAGDGGPATAAKLFSPVGVVVDSAGNLYIADLDNNRVRKVTPGGVISTIAGTGVAGFNGDGTPAMVA